MSKAKPENITRETLLTTVGRDPDAHFGAVSPPVYRTSTILFQNLEAYDRAQKGYWCHEDGQVMRSTYGRFGTPTSIALEDSLALVDGADHCMVTSSGVAAFVTTLTALLSTGDHLLMVDSVYGPTRKFCDDELSRMGIEVEYYDPLIAAGIKEKMKPNTKMVYVESPGSLTFEVQDIPAIAEVAKKHGAYVVMDNSWATSLYFRPFEHGVDIAIQSATKYIGGHSDTIMGVISCNDRTFPDINRAHRNIGACASADTCYMAQRGLRTMAVRLGAQYKVAVRVADWLKTRDEVVEVIHPALPGSRGHELWKRDFTGAAGLFTVLVKPFARKKLAAMMDHLELFGMGYSWGGFESLMIPFNVDMIRSATKWEHRGINLRINIGLEHPDDLIKDLEAGFNRLSA
jgi:cystathionine beta-lyase